MSSMLIFTRVLEWPLYVVPQDVPKYCFCICQLQDLPFNGVLDRACSQNQGIESFYGGPASIYQSTYNTSVDIQINSNTFLEHMEWICRLMLGSNVRRCNLRLSGFLNK